MIEIRADKWTLKDNADRQLIGWEIYRHDHYHGVPDNCHVALAWKLAYASGQEPLPEPVLAWSGPADGSCADAFFMSSHLVVNRTLAGAGPDPVWGWAVCEHIAVPSSARDKGDCTSLRDGQLKAEAALRKLVWAKLMPKEEM